MKGRIPACSAVPYKRHGTTSGSASEAENYTQSVMGDQTILSGNRIGHNPLIPKRFIAPSSHKRPATLSEIIGDFSDSYYNPTHYQGLYHHQSVHGKGSRLIRSEFREMISIGCALLTHYYDVMTGEIGFTNEIGKRIRFSYEQLAEKVGVSLIRIKRFFHFMKERQYITIIEDKKKDDRGGWSSNISRKIIKPAFFIETLGKGAWRKIVKYREWLMKSAKPKNTNQKENVTMVQALLSQAFSRKEAPLSQPKIRPPDKEQNLIHLAMERFKEHPSKTLSDYLRELRTKHA